MYVMAMNVQNWMGEKLQQKVGGVEGYVVAIVLGIVAVAAGAVFREQINNFVTTFFGQFAARANSLF